jgi:hypothetical protein
MSGFHVTDNPVIDIMHDLEEGVCRYDLITIFKYLVNEKLITIRKKTLEC